MNIIQAMLASIPSDKLAQVKSPCVDFVNKIRKVPLTFSGSIRFPKECGLDCSMRFQLGGSMMISHAEIATILNKTVEEVDAMTDIEVEQAAPFLQPAMAKFMSIMDDGGVAWTAQFPSSPWVAKVNPSDPVDPE